MHGDKLKVKPHTERERYVAWVAMLRHHKRPDILVSIARKAPAVRFVVCGGPTTFGTPPGFSERVIDGLCALPNVEYRGQVSSDEAMRVIANAGVFLSTSEEEGFPNTFTQAWTAGTPVVSLRLDPDRLIEQIGMGTVANSVESAVADIDALLARPQRRDEIATRARQFIVDNYSAGAVVKLFENALANK
jgi:glycosyltransferase involved in cell wall biosynthesis